MKRTPTFIQKSQVPPQNSVMGWLHDDAILDCGKLINILILNYDYDLIKFSTIKNNFSVINLPTSIFPWWIHCFSPQLALLKKKVWHFNLRRFYCDRDLLTTVGQYCNNFYTLFYTGSCQDWSLIPRSEKKGKNNPLLSLIFSLSIINNLLKCWCFDRFGIKIKGPRSTRKY